MNGFIRFALGLANMPDATVNNLDRQLPGLARIAAAAKKLEPDLQQLDVIVERMMPTINTEWPDVVAATPTVEELIAFVAGKSQSG